MKFDNNGITQDVIHIRNYELPYMTLEISSDSLMLDKSRPKELLNGMWSFSIDQYDTCLRVKWYREINTDVEGREMPMDYDFDKLQCYLKMVS